VIKLPILFKLIIHGRLTYLESKQHNLGGDFGKLKLLPKLNI
jgi:hypothetical protein